MDGVVGKLQQPSLRSAKVCAGPIDATPLALWLIDAGIMGGGDMGKKSWGWGRRGHIHGQGRGRTQFCAGRGVLEEEVKRGLQPEVSE